MSFPSSSLARGHVWALLLTILWGIAPSAGFTLQGVRLPRALDQDTAQNAYLELGPIKAANTATGGKGFLVTTAATNWFSALDNTQQFLVHVGTSTGATNPPPSSWGCSVYASTPAISQSTYAVCHRAALCCAASPHGNFRTHAQDRLGNPSDGSSLLPALSAFFSVDRVRYNPQKGM